MGDVAPEFGATKINLISLNAFDDRVSFNLHHTERPNLGSTSISSFPFNLPLQ